MAKYKRKNYGNDKSAFVTPINLKTGSHVVRTKSLAKALATEAIASASQKTLLKAANICQSRVSDFLDGVNVNNKATVGSIYNGHGSFFSSASSLITYSVSNKVQNVVLGEATSNITTTSLSVGRTTSKRLINKSSQLVIAKKLIKDSNRDYKSVTKRSSLTASYGFNQRLHSFMLEDLYTTVKDMRVLYKPKWEDYQKNFADKGINKTLYGDFLSEYLQLRIKSESDHYSTMVKIHLVKVHDTDIDLNMVAKGCFPNGKSNVIDALPTDMRYSKLKKNGTFNCVGLTDLNCTLNKSTYFKSNCTIVKTFKRVLGPSDIWKFNYYLSYGPGIVLNELFQSKNDKHPIAYAMVVDIQGDPRASITDSNGLNYDGSSPGRVNFSFERSIKLIKEQDWSNSGEKFTVTQFEDQSMEFEDEGLSEYFTKDREEKMNIDFEDINIVRGVDQKNTKYNLRYSEGRIPVYTNKQFTNVVDMNSSNSTETKDFNSDTEEEQTVILDNYLGDDEEEVT